MRTLDLVRQLLSAPEDPAVTAELVNETLQALPRASARFDLASLIPEIALYGLPQPFYGGPRGQIATRVDDPAETLDRLCAPRLEGGALALEVPQCHALALPTAWLDRTWLEASLSECSLLIAVGADITLAAHVGFSLALEARAALALARETGCRDLRVVCPDDITHGQTPYPDGQARMSVADWRAAGCRTVAFDARHQAGRGWTGLAHPIFHTGRLHVLRGDTDRAARTWRPNGLLAA